jgi:signal transduction histidine kinase
MNTEFGRRQAVLEARAALSVSLDLDQTLRCGAHLCVPRVADWCVVYMKDSDGRMLKSAAVAHADPALESMLERATHAVPDGDAFRRRVLEVAKTGVPEFDADIHDPREIADSLGLPLSEVSRLGVQSWCCLPMQAGGQVVGVASLVSTRGPGCLRDGEELWLAQHLVDCLAEAAARALLHQHALEVIAAREEFLLFAAHELRTPLTGLHLNMQRLMRLVESLPEIPGRERLRAGLQKALQQCGAFETLIQTLLDGASMSNGHLKLHRSTFELGELAREVASDLDLELQNANCPIEVEVEQPVIGEWDRLQIKQVLVNLVSNAMKYAPGRPIDLTVTGMGEMARIVVRDYGDGIPPEHRQRIFERFERLSSTAQHRGWGLGLYIVRQIVEAHGGSIRVVPVAGTGAAFALDLPLAPALARSLHEAPSGD